MTQINDILTLKDPTLLIEGVSLFFQGFTVANTLPQEYFKPLVRIANLNDLFERVTPTEEAVIDYFYSKNASDLSPDGSVEADDDAMMHVVDKETYFKMDTAVSGEEEAPAEEEKKKVDKKQDEMKKILNEFELRLYRGGSQNAANDIGKK